MWIIKEEEEMKKELEDYLNREERTHLIILMSMEQNAEKFLKRNCLSKQDIYNLNKVIEWCKKFNEVLLNRVGDTIRRKIVNTMKINEIRLESKYAPSKPLITEAATEDLEPAIEDLRLLHCNGCSKCNYKDCAVYNICVTCDIPESNDERGCPFRQAIVDYLDDEDEWYE